MKSESSESNFVGKRTTRAYPTKTENMKTSKGDCAEGWKGETFHTEEPANSPKPKMQSKTHMKTVFGELSLVVRSTTSTKTAPR